MHRRMAGGLEERDPFGREAVALNQPYRPATWPSDQDQCLFPLFHTPGGVGQSLIDVGWFKQRVGLQDALTAAAAASAEGDAFLAENAKRDGVTVTDSGLQFEVLVQGDGATPTYEDTVRTHYHGSFINGDVFDSSVVRGQPAEFPVSGVIAGWTEALQLMPVGTKLKLFVPHHLAYGERGAGASIPPYSTLVFEVELLDII